MQIMTPLLKTCLKLKHINVKTGTCQRSYCKMTDKNSVMTCVFYIYGLVSRCSFQGELTNIFFLLWLNYLSTLQYILA